MCAFRCCLNKYVLILHNTYNTSYALSLSPLCFFVFNGFLFFVQCDTFIRSSVRGR